MTNKLYVGGIAYATEEDTLKDEFAKAGNVQSVKIIMDRDTGKSKGFGFVEMETEDEAKAAIEMFHEKELDGRTIRVNEARPQR